MHLTRTQFVERYRARTLRLAFIGPSNAGKTFRTLQLKREKGFEAATVDQYIGKALGIADEAGLARWMGPPDAPEYAARQAQYLDMEERLTRQANPQKAANFVLDTTGSVIYLSAALKDWLRRSFLVVYGRVSRAQEEAWVRSISACPKPMVWGPHYRPQPGEPKQKTLRRCAGDLLAWRHDRYRRLADLTLSDFNAPEVSATAFWASLLDALP